MRYLGVQNGEPILVDDTFDADVTRMVTAAQAGVTFTPVPQVRTAWEVQAARNQACSPARASAEARVNTLRGSRKNISPPRPSLLQERNLLPEAPPPDPPRILAQSRRAVREEKATRASRAARLQPGADAVPTGRAPETPLRGAARLRVLAAPRPLAEAQDAQLRLPDCPAIPVVTVHISRTAPVPSSGFGLALCSSGPHDTRRVRRAVGYECTPCAACQSLMWEVTRK